MTGVYMEQLSHRRCTLAGCRAGPSKWRISNPPKRSPLRFLLECIDQSSIELMVREVQCGIDLLIDVPTNQARTSNPAECRRLLKGVIGWAKLSPWPF
jgi:hypothetical protein